MIRHFPRACAFTFAMVLLAAAPSSAAAIGIGDGHLFGYVDLGSQGSTLTAFNPDGFVTFKSPAVHFGGQTFDTISVAEDGFLVLGGEPIGMDTKTNKILADAGLPFAILAPLWTDLTGGQLRIANLTNGSKSWIVVEWASMRAANGLYSFQVWLGQEEEDITFAYLQQPQSGQQTIGAQDSSGTVGRTLYFNGRGILPRNDLRVVTEGLPVEQQPVPVPEPATLTLLAGGLAFSAIGRLRKASAKG